MGYSFTVRVVINFRDISKGYACANCARMRKGERGKEKEREGAGECSCTYITKV